MNAPGTGDLEVMAEYECYSFWVASNGIRENVDPATLGLPGDLTSEIGSWEQSYDETYDQDDPGSSGFPDEDSERAFNVQGLRLAARTSEALGAGWTVRYYDTLTRKLVAPVKSVECRR